MNDQKNNSNAVDLFWTGGWDSSYRLLELLLIKKLTVQPHYIIDARRPSSRYEIHSMNTLKKCLDELFPEVREQLLPTIYFERNQIIQDSYLREAYGNIKKHRHIGDQYVWLAEYCKEHHLDSVEISVEKSYNHSFNDDVHHYIGDEYNGNNTAQNELFKELKPHFNTLFVHFNFPVSHLTKWDMLYVARDKQWMHLMNRTWFCFRPKLFDQPCGSCKPCLQIISDEFTWRIPRHRIYMGKMRILYSNWRNRNYQ
jgi:hypothetical protein